MKKKELILRYIVDIFGVFLIGIGIAFAKRADLGISPISSVPNVLSIKFPFFTVGTWLTLWNCFFVIVQLIILRKKFKPIQFIQLPISFLLGIFTDFGVMLVSSIPASSYPIRLLLVVISVSILSFGISLTVVANTVMNVGEAMVDVVAKLVGKPFGSVKLVFDLCCVTLSVCMSLLFFNFQLVGVREGTLIAACFTGIAVKWLTKRIKNPIDSIVSK